MVLLALVLIGLTVNGVEASSKITECLVLEEECQGCVPSNCIKPQPNAESDEECSKHCTASSQCRGIARIKNSSSCHTIHCQSTHSSASIESYILACRRCKALKFSNGEMKIQWATGISNASRIEVGLVLSSRQPNTEPFGFPSNLKNVAAFKETDRQNSVFVWRPKVLSGRYWVSVRPVPFSQSEECSFPSSGYFRYRSPICNAVPVSERIDCGYGGIDHIECNARGCCFDDSNPDAINCFSRLNPKNPKTTRLALKSSVNTSTDCMDLVEKCRNCVSALSDSCITRVLDVETEMECSQQCQASSGCLGIGRFENRKTCLTLSCFESNFSQSNDKSNLKVCKRLGCSGHVSDGRLKVIWTSSFVQPARKMVEIGLIKYDSRPTIDSFSAVSNKDIVWWWSTAKVQEGSGGWALPSHISGKYVLFVRSLPFSLDQDCGTILLSGSEVSSKVCGSIAFRQRVDCGFPGITHAQCHRSGCCFDDSNPTAYNCFKMYSSASWQYRTEIALAWVGKFVFAVITNQYFFTVTTGIAMSLLFEGIRIYREAKAQKKNVLGILELLQAAMDQRRVDLQLANPGNVACVVCVTNVPDVLLQPCEHICFCHVCLRNQLLKAKELSQPLKCSYCSQVVNRVSFARIRGFEVLE